MLTPTATVQTVVLVALPAIVVSFAKVETVSLVVRKALKHAVEAVLIPTATAQTVVLAALNAEQRKSVFWASV